MIVCIILVCLHKFTEYINAVFDVKAGGERIREIYIFSFIGK